MYTHSAIVVAEMIFYVLFSCATCQSTNENLLIIISTTLVGEGGRGREGGREGGRGGREGREGREGGREGGGREGGREGRELSSCFTEQVERENLQISSGPVSGQSEMRITDHIQ